ncbi:hypothetical protein BAT02nite_32300 [Bacillus atrophaeus]|nr:hypothetical protein RA13_21195 [Bacillus atrophaeus]KXZ18274.1 hypothetical protein AXI57_18850 [Bacillus atrophaeus]MDQ0926316.1 hypothetical protein [Bacillus atrophaeus]GED03586.1 hypothetical protein BAT02nite_32300 [Bacillus atrophaeus]
MFDYIRIIVYLLGSIGMIYACYRDFNYARKEQNDKCIFFKNKKLSGTVLFCYLFLFFANLRDFLFLIINSK